jgi:Putative Flp pilus-assembly TadE/G-like
MSRLRSRKGATLVLVAIMMTALIGFAGIAVDASRLYVMRVELQTAADAAAIAGTVEVRDKRPTNATTLALQYAANNVVERKAPTIAASDVEPGVWDYTTRTFSLLGSWTDPTLNAVRATAHYPGSYTFARVFGGTGQTVNARAIAAIGYVGTQECLKPWTVSYQTLLNALYPPAGTKDAATYNLTPQDITTLAGMSAPANVVPLLNTGTNVVTNGNIAQVVVSTPWNGTQSYKAAIAGACANLDIGPGTILEGDPGAGPGQTAQAMQTLCGVSGNPNSFACPGVKVKLAVWDQNNGLNGSNLRVRVKYVAVFGITQFSKGTGAGGGDQIYGYFTSLPTDGTFSTSPTPTTRIVLVQ